MTVRLEPHGEGFAAHFPYDPGMVQAIKLCPGFHWNQTMKAWVSDGPEVLLEMERYGISFVPVGQAVQMVQDFHWRMNEIITLKLQNREQWEDPEKRAEGIYAFQAIGSRILALQKKGLLADDMGLGKSKQALDAAKIVGSGHILVVAPKTLLFNWEREVKKWHPEWRVVVVSTPKGERQKEYQAIRQSFRERNEQPLVVITNYEKVTMDDWPLELRWGTFVFDEAHYIKTTTSARHKRVKAIAAHSNHVFGLTGTPLEMRAEETYGIMSAIRPAVYGGWVRFRDQHLDVDDWGRVVGIRDDARVIFRERLGPWMTRRTKAMVAGQLPAKIYNVVGVDFSEEERAIYLQICKGFDRWMEEQGKMVGSASALTQLIRFQQFTSSPQLLDVTHLGYGTKFTALVELLDGWDGRALVFTRFKEMAHRLHNWLELPERATITGDVTDPAERLARVEDFNAGKLGKVFIGTDAMAFGLSFTADLAIHYDKLWNPAKEWQREDRCHGIGRGMEGRTTNVVHLLTNNTIDVGMHLTTAARADLFKDIVDGAEAQVLNRYQARDFQALIQGKVR